MKNQSSIIIILLITLLLSSSCSVFKNNQSDPPMGTFIAESQFKDFIPISPTDFEQEVIVFDTTRNDFDTLSIKELATRKSEVIRFLPNETVYSTLEKKGDSVEAKYGPASITGAKGSYTVTLDYAKFTTLKYKLNKEKCAGFTKVGVGMRITARITTLEAGIDVSSLFGLGLAAKTGRLKGQLSIDIIGMESSQITDLLNLPVDISEASIQTALQSLSAIKSKIYDTQTNLYPQIIAIKNTNGDCDVFQFLEEIEPQSTIANESSSSSKILQLQQQTQQQQQQIQQQQQQIQQQQQQIQQQQQQIQQQLGN